jgi:nicotinate-nucleotide adenylyltransferase
MKESILLFSKHRMNQSRCPMKKGRKIGVLGGTFDPPHVAHLIIAEEAAQTLGLEHVLFVPAVVPPHKVEVPISPFDVRMLMVEAAISGNAVFKLSDIESRLPSPNYTVNTVEALKGEEANPADIHLIIGSDSLLDFPSWKAPTQLLAQSQVVVYPRSDFPVERAPDDIVAHVQILDVPEIPISSTHLRTRVAAGRSIRYWVPDSVIRIIDERKLYLNRV